jgi:hypothetical protein
LQKPYKIIYNRFIIIAKTFLDTRARGFIFINREFVIQLYKQLDVSFYKTRDQAKLKGYNKTGREIIEYIVFF